MNSNIVWGSIIGLGAIYETYDLLTKKYGDTLSMRTRAWFQTKTKPGRLVFGVSWVTFAAWFLWHILWEK